MSRMDAPGQRVPLFLLSLGAGGGCRYQRGLGMATLLPPQSYLMAPPGSRDIFTVYLIKEFAGRMFLALHE